MAKGLTYPTFLTMSPESRPALQGNRNLPHTPTEDGDTVVPTQTTRLAARTGNTSCPGMQTEGVGLAGGPHDHAATQN